MAPPVGEKETRYLKSVMKERPDSLLFARLADVYRKEGNIDQAIELCLKGLAAYPYYSTGRVLLGRCYLEQQKTGEAIQAFSMVCSTDRRNQVAIKMLADIFARQGMDRKAGDLYALLLSMDPEQPTLRQLSSRYAASGNTDLFVILGLQAPAGGRSVLPEGPFEDRVVPDGTFVEQPEHPFGQFDTGTDEGAGMQPGFGGEDTAAPLVDKSETVGLPDVSGSDITDRMSMLFNEQQPPEVYSSQPEMPHYPQDSFSSAEPDLSGILSPDGEDVSGTDISNRIEELFSENEQAADVATPVDVSDPQNGAEGIKRPADFDAFTELSDVPAMNDAVGDISGTDISSRLTELFGDEQGVEKQGTDEELTAWPEAAAPSEYDAGLERGAVSEDSEGFSTIDNRNDGITLEDLSLDTFQMPDGPDIDTAAAPDFPELDLSYPATAEPDVLPLDGFGGQQEFEADGVIELGVSSNEGPAISSENLSEVSDSESGDTGFNGAAIQFTDESDESAADGGMITGADVFDRIGSTFGETSEPPMAFPATEDVEELKISGPPADNFADDEMITGADVFDRIDSTFEETAAPQSASSATMEMDVADAPEELFTGDDIADRLGMVFDDKEDVPLVPEDQTPDFPDEEPLEKTAVEDRTSFFQNKPAEDLFDEAAVTGADFEDRISMVFPESDAESLSDDSHPAGLIDKSVSGSMAPAMDVPVSLESDEEQGVTGDDISDRIGMVFENSTGEMTVPGFDHGDELRDTDMSIPETGSRFETLQDEEFGSNVAGAIDELTDDVEDDGTAAGSEPSPASLAEASDTLFAERYGVGRVSDDAVIDQDFLAPDFEETMQFDSALFEQMLNPTTQSAPFMQAEQDDRTPYLNDRPIAEVVQPPDTTTGRLMGSMDTVQDLDIDSLTADPGATDPQELILDAGSEHGEIYEDRFEPVRDISDESLGFEATTEQYGTDIPDLIDDTPRPDTRLDKTAVFEVNVAETHTDLIIDVDEPVPMEEAPGSDDRTGEDDSQVPFDRKLMQGAMVGEHTEAVDVFLDELDYEDPPGALPTITGNRQVPDETFAGVVLIDSNQPDEPQEDDEAFLETMYSADMEFLKPQEYTDAVNEGNGSAFFDMDDTAAGQSDTHHSADGPAVVTGSDIEQRLDNMFQSDDLLSLSSDNLLPPEDEQDEVMDQVSEFYTISGENAARGAAGDVPDTIADVEFKTEAAIENGATMELSVDDVRKMMEEDVHSGAAAGEVLPDVELFEECRPGVEQFSEETVIIDKRDKPFDIPDHVLTPTLADIYYQQGQYQLALQIYTRLSERDPDNEKVIARMDEIRQAIITSDGAEQDAGASRGGLPARKIAAGLSQKKKTVPEVTDDAKPLAGVRIKKRIKSARKSTRKRS